VIGSFMKQEFFVFRRGDPLNRWIIPHELTRLNDA
jgi:hypothetical protein